MWCRFLAISILLTVGFWKSIERIQRESLQSVVEESSFLLVTVSCVCVCFCSLFFGCFWFLCLMFLVLLGVLG